MCAGSRPENASSNRCGAVGIFRRHVDITHRHIFDPRSCTRQAPERGCQLIVAIEAECVKGPVSPLPSTVGRMELWVLAPVVTVAVLAVIVAVSVAVTEVSVTVSEVPVGPQLRSTPNDAEPACGMLSGGT